MKRLLVLVACMLLVGGWAWPWSPVPELSLPYTHDIRLLAVDAAHAPSLTTIWKVTPANAGQLTLDQPQGWTVIFTPLPVKQTVYVWSKTGTKPWRKIAVRLLDPAIWMDAIAPGESWIHGTR